MSEHKILQLSKNKNKRRKAIATAQVLFQVMVFVNHVNNHL